ncbi:MAG: tRNA (guanosine(46)-N7)-methyltransferase TrmB [Clostridia bacterium]|nr:tRNA (guanosine(46)-N7)-methyltransferase TrmB [Clostridia bacterium]
MRIRRRKHLEERLEKIKDYIIIADKKQVNVLEALKDKKYIDFAKEFGNNNPICLEIGCGKGKFIIEKAKQNPNVNYIAVEMLENIILIACETAKEEGLKNVKFINSGAEYLRRYIKENSINEIYLNFSPPYHKNGYESRRLSNERFAKSYFEMLINGGKLIQKTDDKIFFDYSFEKFLECGFKVVDVSNELYLPNSTNIITEYESKWLSLNMPIYSLHAIKQLK